MTDSPKPQQGAYASCCVLSYNRPHFLKTAIATLTENAGAPLELIVHDDGSRNEEVHRLLASWLDAGVVSSVILNPPGHNQGVGEAVRRMFAVATGDPLIKIDQDLIFKEDWLRTVHRTFYEAGQQHGPTLGALGGFKYGYDPVNHSKMLDRDWGSWLEVRDFVGSLIAVPRVLYERFGPFPTGSDAFAEDVEFKQLLQAHGYALGLPAEDIVTNQGFGVGPSTVVTAPNTVAPIQHSPLLHGGP